MPAANGDTGLQVFMNTVIVNLILVLVIIVIQHLFYVESTLDHFLLVLKALTPIIWICKSPKLQHVLKGRHQ